MKSIRTYVTAFILMITSAFVLLPVASVGAVGIEDVCTGSNSTTGVCEENNKASNSNADSLVKNIVNTLLFIVGAISVVMIIIGGLLFVTSSGDSSNITKAKNTITYAVVGLVVSFLAYAIVNWVVALF